jgi:invasion protein IalB
MITLNSIEHSILSAALITYMAELERELESEDRQDEPHILRGELQEAHDLWVKVCSPSRASRSLPVSSN